ncbi:MAG: hypothetical protein AMXMBFR82_32130 [Candidatus Hydrogenedentota bacterium]
MLASLAVFLTFLGGCTAGDESSPSSRNTVTIFAAASTTDVVTTVVERFEERHPDVTVVTSFAASSTLARQIEQGANADLFLAANADWVEHLAKRGLVAESSELFGNRLVVVVPRDSALPVHAPGDLLEAAVTRIAVGDTESVPAGIYAKQALSSLGLWDELEPKCVPSANVRQALLYVERGETEAGIVYATDADVSAGVRVAFAFDGALHDAIMYPLALLKRAEENATAQSLYDFLGGRDAATIFRESGFTLLNPVR